MEKTDSPGKKHPGEAHIREPQEVQHAEDPQLPAESDWIYTRDRQPHPGGGHSISGLSGHQEAVPAERELYLPSSTYPPPSPAAACRTSEAPASPIPSP